MTTLAPFMHRIGEATVAVDDGEGFWVEGRRLDRAEIDGLNAQVHAGLGAVIRILDPDTGWVVTFGNGFHYLVEPVVRCRSCGVVAYESEMHETDPVHGACWYPGWEQA